MTNIIVTIRDILLLINDIETILFDTINNINNFSRDTFQGDRFVNPNLLSFRDIK